MFSRRASAASASSQAAAHPPRDNGHSTLSQISNLLSVSSVPSLGHDTDSTASYSPSYSSAHSYPMRRESLHGPVPSSPIASISNVSNVFGIPSAGKIMPASHPLMTTTSAMRRNGGTESPVRRTTPPQTPSPIRVKPVSTTASSASAPTPLTPLLQLQTTAEPAEEVEFIPLPIVPAGRKMRSKSMGASESKSMHSKLSTVHTLASAGGAAASLRTFSVGTQEAHNTTSSPSPRSKQAELII
ncbi:hypothetical protein BC830DRAFT_1108071 [Chytriomyces sp. MP71]|nr:hypothetical protein BC830DRAFT_1108071 [Chytriomyces sp. MP71]